MQSLHNDSIIVAVIVQAEEEKRVEISRKKKLENIQKNAERSQQLLAIDERSEFVDNCSRCDDMTLIVSQY